jgi:Mg-chelatase subunit ChlD
MNNDGAKPPQPLTSVLSAARAFVDRLRPTDQVGVVTFATNATLVQALTRDLPSVSAGVLGLTISPKEEQGSTNPGDAFIKTLEELNSSRHSKDARKVAILLTDGLATAPDENPNEFALEQAELLKNSGVTVFTIGLGNGADMDFVRTLASSPNQAYQALSANDVANIYRTITASLCEDGAAVIDIVPKSSASFQSLE